MAFGLRWSAWRDARGNFAGILLWSCTWKLARCRTAFSRGAVVLIEPRQRCEFQAVLCNGLEAARAWGWAYVIAHGYGSFAFWNEMRCSALDLFPLYYELPKDIIASGQDYSDFLKEGDLWNWLSEKHFSHVIITQTDVIINSAVDIMPFVMTYDFLGCKTRWHQHEFPPHLRGRAIAAVNGGFSLRSIPYTVNATKILPSKSTKSSQMRKAKDWSQNHEDVYFAWAIWILGGDIASGQLIERNWCTQKAKSTSGLVAVHKPDTALFNSLLKLFIPSKCTLSSVERSGVILS